MKKYIFSSLIICFLLTGCTPDTIVNSNTSLEDKIVNQGVTEKSSNDAWVTVSTLDIDLDGNGSKETAIYSKSKIPTGISGSDQDEYGVKLTIIKDKEVAFEYTPSEEVEGDNVWPTGYYREDTSSVKHFYSEDITGDNTPEIIFTTGIDGASDSSNCLNIITYNKSKKAFDVINKKEFCKSFNTGIEIEKLSTNINGSQIIKAIPSNGVIGGNKVEQPFVLSVYTWNGTNFDPYKTFTSSRNYEGGQNAVEGESYLLQKAFWTIDSPTVQKPQRDTNTDIQEKAPVPSATPNGTYENVDGDTIPSPYYAPSAPAGATAQCRDGTYSFSQHRSGTCSHHGGVAEWL